MVYLYIYYNSIIIAKVIGYITMLGYIKFCIHYFVGLTF